MHGNTLTEPVYYINFADSCVRFLDKMVGAKWYTDNYGIGQNAARKVFFGTDKRVPIKPSINPAPTDKMISSLIPLPL